MSSEDNKLAFKTFTKIANLCLRNKLVIFFLVSHIGFAIFLGQMFAFAPDEKGYLYTFNNVFSLPIDTEPQSGSGWITAPTLFLWVAYFPAKILNLVGVSDFLSIRLLSIAMTAFSLYLLSRINGNIQKRTVSPKSFILLSFFIPSVFLWTSTGLREAFIIFEITLFLAGLNSLFLRKIKVAIPLLFAGSYGLLSTKPYLWFLLMISLILFLLISLISKTHKEFRIKVFIAGCIAPIILFSGTTSQFALNYIFSASLNEAGIRSGDSITQIDDVTFHGDYTLIALRFHLIENPDSFFSKAFAILKLDDKVENLWLEKLQAGLISEDKRVGKDTSSLNGHILKPGVITEPWTMLWPAFVFLAGPFPFIGEPGIAAKISSFESPLWWLLYSLVIYQFYRFRRFKIFRDPAILFTLIFLAGEIAFSSLVEVNLGTSFRHRSILLVPLVFLYVRITQRAHDLSNADSKQIT
jgi:hypothetical protein